MKSNNKVIVTSKGAGMIIFDSNTLSELNIIPNSNSAYKVVEFSSNIIISNSWYPEIQVVDVDKYEIIYKLKAYSDNYINDLLLIEGNYLVSISFYSKKLKSHLINVDDMQNMLVEYSSYSRSSCPISLSRINNDYFACGYEDNKITILKNSSLSIVKEISISGLGLYNGVLLEFYSDNVLIATSYKMKNVFIEFIYIDCETFYINQFNTLIKNGNDDFLKVETFRAWSISKNEYIVTSFDEDFAVRFNLTN